MAIQATQPAEGQIDVPVDARLRVFVQSQGGGSDDYSNPELQLLENGSPVLAAQRTLPGNLPVFVLLPHAPLTANTSFVLEIRGRDGDDEEALTTVTFTTGSSTTPAVTELPALELLSARHDLDAHGDGHELNHVDFRITPAIADPAGLSLVRIVKDDYGIFSFPIGPADPIEGSAGVLGAEDQDVCLRAVHESANGEVQMSEPVCITPELSGGCRSSRGSMPSGLWGFAPLALALLAIRSGRFSLRGSKGHSTAPGSAKQT
jgi:hypothetical protein